MWRAAAIRRLDSGHLSSDGSSAGYCMPSGSGSSLPRVPPHDDVRAPWSLRKDRPRELQPDPPPCPRPYFLIDFENVQPKALDRLKPRHGAHQGVILGAAPDQADAGTGSRRSAVRQPNRTEYIQITGSGPDAVDFHIAFYDRPAGAVGARRGLQHPSRSASTRFPSPLIIAPRTLSGHRLRTACGNPAGAPRQPVRRSKSSSSHSRPGRHAANSGPNRRSGAQPAEEARGGKNANGGKAGRGVSPSALRVGRHRWLPGCRRRRQAGQAGHATLVDHRRAYQPPLDDQVVEAVIQSLRSSKKIAIDGTKVDYTL